MAIDTSKLDGWPSSSAITTAAEDLKTAGRDFHEGGKSFTSTWRNFGSEVYVGPGGDDILLAGEFPVVHSEAVKILTSELCRMIKSFAGNYKTDEQNRSQVLSMAGEFNRLPEYNPSYPTNAPEPQPNRERIPWESTGFTGQWRVPERYRYNPDKYELIDDGIVRKHLVQHYAGVGGTPGIIDESYVQHHVDKVARRYAEDVELAVTWIKAVATDGADFKAQIGDDDSFLDPATSKIAPLALPIIQTALEAKAGEPPLSAVMEQFKRPAPPRRGRVDTTTPDNPGGTPKPRRAVPYWEQTLNEIGERVGRFGRNVGRGMWSGLKGSLRGAGGVLTALGAGLTFVDEYSDARQRILASDPNVDPQELRNEALGEAAVRTVAVTATGIIVGSAAAAVAVAAIPAAPAAVVVLATGVAVGLALEHTGANDKIADGASWLWRKIRGK